MTKYIHYGSDRFDISKFNQYSSNFLPNKPNGCLWASPVSAKNISWYEWAKDNTFHCERLDKHFTFSLNVSAKIFRVTNNEEFNKLKLLIGKKIWDNPFSHIRDEWTFDFKKLISLGYDALEIELNTDEIYWGMYGWDVDSIVVFNPLVIEVSNDIS